MRRRTAFTCDPCYSRYGALRMEPEDILGCVDGKDNQGNPCWTPPPPPAWQDPYDTDWALPDFTVKPPSKLPWLLGAIAAGAVYLWVAR